MYFVISVKCLNIRDVRQAAKTSRAQVERSSLRKHVKPQETRECIKPIFASSHPPHHQTKVIQRQKTTTQRLLAHGASTALAGVGLGGLGLSNTLGKDLSVLVL